MAQNTEAPGSVATDSRASQDFTGFVDWRWANSLVTSPEEDSRLDASQPSQSITRVPSRVITPSSIVKTALVTTLGWLLAWRPGWAMLLGRVVWWGFPSLRGA